MSVCVQPSVTPSYRTGAQHNSYLHMCSLMCVCLVSWGPTGANRQSSVHANSVSQNLLSREKLKPPHAFIFEQKVCYWTTLSKLAEKICTLDPKRSIRRTIKEKMLLILYSLRRLAQQSSPVSPLLAHSLILPYAMRKRTAGATILWSQLYSFFLLLKLWWQLLSLCSACFLGSESWLI